MRLIAFAVMALCLLASAVVLGQVIYIPPPSLPGFYVAIGGSDSAAGSFAAPFKSVQACQTAMQGSSLKTCYIRAGTYTGGGVGYTAQTITATGGGWQIKVALWLTSADNGEFFGGYPPDFPSNGISSAIFDGGAGTWSSSSGAASGCVTNSNPTAAVGRFAQINGASNITIDRLLMRNFCYGGVTVHGGVERPNGCAPVTTALGVTTGNTISNNYVQFTSGFESQCAGDFKGNMFAIGNHGDARSTTITHNVVDSNTGNGIFYLLNEDCFGYRVDLSTCHNSALAEFANNLIEDHNAVFDVLTQQNDGAAIGGNDVAEGSTNLKILYNYVHNYGIVGQARVGQAGGNNKAIYMDDGASNNTIQGNVVSGSGAMCHFQHAGVNNVRQYNICDGGDIGAVVPGDATDTAFQGYLSNDSNTGDLGNLPWGANSKTNDIEIANATQCGQGLDDCIYNIVGDDPIIGHHNGNFYWNYGGGGNTVLTNEAAANGETGIKTFDPFPNKCPGGNINSWGYFIPGGNSVYSNGYAAQPTGWATPGFWGPPGFVLPHGGGPLGNNPPSYGPTC